MASIRLVDRQARESERSMQEDANRQIEQVRVENFILSLLIAYTAMLICVQLSSC